MIDKLFENNIEFSMFANKVGENTVTTLRIKEMRGWNILLVNGVLSWLTHHDGAVVHANRFEIVSDEDIKMKFYQDDVATLEYVCAL